VLGLTPTARANWALEPISIHLSYSSRISSFWAVVKCPRLEERDGTSKDITDFSPRQYCQITVTRQPDTEGAHRCLGTPPLSRQFGPDNTAPRPPFRACALTGARNRSRRPARAAMPAAGPQATRKTTQNRRLCDLTSDAEHNDIY